MWPLADVNVCYNRIIGVSRTLPFNVILLREWVYHFVRRSFCLVGKDGSGFWPTRPLKIYTSLYEMPLYGVFCRFIDFVIAFTGRVGRLQVQPIRHARVWFNFRLPGDINEVLEKSISYIHELMYWY